MDIYTKQNIINYTSDPDEVNDFKYDRKLQIARKALREDDMEAKRTDGTAKCVSDMLKSKNKEILALSVIIELSFLKGANNLDFPVFS